MWSKPGNSRADWRDLATALGRFALALAGLLGSLAFLALQVFLAFMLGFGAVVAGLLGAGRRRR